MYLYILGVCETKSTRLSFDVVHLANSPPACKYLSGILDMFKEKISVQYSTPVTVSARLTHSLKAFPLSVHAIQRRYAFAESDDEDEDATNTENSPVLPFGVSVDPVAELVLYCTWPELAENVVVDSQTYTDLDPMLAPLWSLRARYERLPVCFLSECLTEYSQLSDSTRSLTELLGESYQLGGSDLDDINPLDRLTESKITTLTSSVLPSLGPTANRSEGKRRNDGPLHDEQMMRMLYYMFPDAQKESPCSYNLPDGDAVSNYYDRNLIGKIL